MMAHLDLSTTASQDNGNDGGVSLRLHRLSGTGLTYRRLLLLTVCMVPVPDAFSAGAATAASSASASTHISSAPVAPPRQGITVDPGPTGDRMPVTHPGKMKTEDRMVHDPSRSDAEAR